MKNEFQRMFLQIEKSIIKTEKYSEEQVTFAYRNQKGFKHFYFCLFAFENVFLLPNDGNVQGL